MREQNGLQNFPEKGKACEAPFSLIPRSIQNQPIITFQLSCTQLIHENEYMEGGKKKPFVSETELHCCMYW